MKKIIYYVASSIDGYISGKDEDISRFVNSENGIDKYLTDLEEFKTVIMGRCTYESGYKFGLEPGKAAYPHMDHYIFSKTISFDHQDEKINVVTEFDVSKINEIKKQSNTDIYLCGGGVLAGWLLDNELIDVLKLKLNPIILGQGVKIFGNSTKDLSMHLNDTIEYDKGLLINTYDIKY